MRILILNGSPHGDRGNCHILIQNVIERTKKKFEIQVLHLADQLWNPAGKKKVFKDLEKADGFIFVTGTYWDSWGSPLQFFLENITPLEGSAAFLGKPAVVLVLNHSVGGKGVLSRLQGVLSTLGCLIPPMSGMVYAWVSEQLLNDKSKNSATKDLWSIDDMDDILANFQKALQLKVKWKGWPVDRKDYRKVWLRPKRP